jgi:hypothetical protein
LDSAQAGLWRANLFPYSLFPLPADDGWMEAEIRALASHIQPKETNAMMKCPLGVTSMSLASHFLLYSEL